MLKKIFWWSLFVIGLVVFSPILIPLLFLQYRVDKKFQNYVSGNLERWIRVDELLDDLDASGWRKMTYESFIRMKILAGQARCRACTKCRSYARLPGAIRYFLLFSDPIAREESPESAAEYREQPASLDVCESCEGMHVYFYQPRKVESQNALSEVS